MARRHPRRHQTSHERWLVSYADFITLLFAFFTMMYAVSTVDAEKFKSAASSMQSAFSAQGGAPTNENRPGVFEQSMGETMLPVAGSPGRALADLADVRAGLDGRLTREIAAGLVDLHEDPRGLVVSMQEAGSFTTGRADLAPEAATILAEIASSLRTVDNFVRVEGHTDDVPISTERYKSNWDLSAARATIVVRALTEQEGLLAERFSAAGYAEFRPRIVNDSPENRARNRRVDLIILNPATSRAEEPRAR